MSKEKKSFFERLTGTIKIREDIDDDTADIESAEIIENAWEEEKDAELTIDMYQTNEAIIIKTFVAGIAPDDIDVNITRELVTIKGNRKPERVIRDEDIFVQELYWGAFSRTVSLPQEVDVEECDAINKGGLLIITMPKLDKKRQMKLKVKNSMN